MYMPFAKRMRVVAVSRPPRPARPSTVSQTTAVSFFVLVSLSTPPFFSCALTPGGLNLETKGCYRRGCPRTEGLSRTKPSSIAGADGRLSGWALVANVGVWVDVLVHNVQARVPTYVR